MPGRSKSFAALSENSFWAPTPMKMGRKGRLSFAKLALKSLLIIQLSTNSQLPHLAQFLSVLWERMIKKNRQNNIVVKESMVVKG